MAKTGTKEGPRMSRERAGPWPWSRKRQPAGAAPGEAGPGLAAPPPQGANQPLAPPRVSSLLSGLGSPPASPSAPDAAASVGLAKEGASGAVQGQAPAVPGPAPEAKQAKDPMADTLKDLFAEEVTVNEELNRLVRGLQDVNMEALVTQCRDVAARLRARASG